MIFKDEEVENLNPNDVDQLAYLIVNKLCGKNSIKATGNRFEMIDIEIDSNLLEKFIRGVSTKELDHFQFNELLLLLDQHRVSRDFFDFLFDDKEKKKLKDLKDGIIKLRGFAMLRYGNFRYAYKELNQKSKEEIEKSLEQFIKQPDSLIKKFKKRKNISTLEMEKIPKEKTWYNGYISKRDWTTDSNRIKYEIRKDKHNISKDKITFGDRLDEMGNEIEVVQEKSQKNTDIYLTWDYIDVYVATSMRKRWEYENVSEFIEDLFGSSHYSKFDITKLGLRYFDPTRSHCSNRIDKGLVEALMLKRAGCTIYMVQEGDTLGKISELASTLAQRKPVIAYVPEINVNEYTKKIKDYPLDFFEGRFFDLLSSGIFNDKDCQKDLNAVDDNYEKKILDTFLPEVRKYKKNQPYKLWTEKEDEFKEEIGKDFHDKICRFLSIAEKHNFDKRAKDLIEFHPLAIQVHLESGVANGVLVVRNVKDCAELLYRILTNSMEFEIIYNKEHNFYSLNEKISGCPFRVVTGYRKLTNSYWNLYLEKKF